MKSNRFFSSRNIAFLAILLALVVVLQVFGSYLRVGATSLSFVLVPIVLGAVLIGPLAGIVLGFAFGLIVLIYGITGADAFTFILFTDHPVLTSVLCLGKGMAAGLVPGLLFAALKKKHRYAGVLTASLSAPVVNTGLFIVGALFMSDTLTQNFVTDGMSVLYFLIIGCAGVNFLIELAINLVASPAIFRVSELVKRSRAGTGSGTRPSAEQSAACPPRAEARPADLSGKQK